METISGLSNWKLTVRQEADHAAILRAVTCDEKAVLPDELLGLPVTVLDDHALAPNARPVEGEQVTVTCGRPGEVWDNRQLKSLVLPRHLTHVEQYALYGCRTLQTLYLQDTIDHWGGGSLMNCGALRHIVLTRTGERHSQALAFLCGELHEELTVTIREAGGAETRLIFPEFTEAYEENCPAHHFDFKIYGGGHPYHHVFRDKQLHLRDYDNLWEKYLREEHEPAQALALACCRLRWPTDLSAAAARQYWSYLQGRKADALLAQLKTGDTAGLKLLLEGLQPEPPLLARLCDAARQAQNTQALALLLQQQHQSAPRGLDKNFDL